MKVIESDSKGLESAPNASAARSRKEMSISEAGDLFDKEALKNLKEAGRRAREREEALAKQKRQNGAKTHYELHRLRDSGTIPTESRPRSLREMSIKEQGDLADKEGMGNLRQAAIRGGRTREGARKAARPSEVAALKFQNRGNIQIQGNI